MISFVLFALTQAHAAETAVVAGVATKEAVVQIAGESLTRIDVDGRTYFLKSPRPGSVLTEVRCTAQPDASAPATLESATRARAFTERLTEGCSGNKERFTFEQTPNLSAIASQRVNQQPAPKPANARSFPPDTDPHIIPDSFGPDVQYGKQF